MSRIIGGLLVATNICAGIYGASKVKEATCTKKNAKRRHKSNVSRYEIAQKACAADMDKLGTLEMGIFSSFEHFSDLIERIQNRPKLEEIDLVERDLPHDDLKALQELAVGSGVLLGSQFGDVIITEAPFQLPRLIDILAMLLPLGGQIFALGTELSNDAHKAWDRTKRAEEQIDKVCNFLDELKETSTAYRGALEQVRCLYVSHIAFLENLLRGETDWNMFSDTAKLNIMNLVLLVSVLYAMCKEKLVLKGKEDGDGISINKEGISTQMSRAEAILGQIAPL